MPAPTAHAIVRDNCAFHLGELREAALRAPTLEARAPLVLGVCTQLRRLGLVALLGQGDVQGYVAGLHASAQAYLDLLRPVRWDAVRERYHLCASRAQPFFDAIAIEDWASAGAIAAASCPTLVTGDEYPEDFAYVRLLMTLAGPDAPDTAARLLAQLEAEAPEGDAWVDVCRALLAQDADVFERVLERFVQEREHEAASRLEAVGVDGGWRATERVVFVEGLALASADSGERAAVHLVTHVPRRAWAPGTRRARQGAAAVTRPLERVACSRAWPPRDSPPQTATTSSACRARARTTSRTSASSSPSGG